MGNNDDSTGYMLHFQILLHGEQLIEPKPNHILFKTFSIKCLIFSYLSVLTFVLVFMETIVLSIHIICLVEN